MNNESTPETQYEKVSKILFCPLVFPFLKDAQALLSAKSECPEMGH